MINPFPLPPTNAPAYMGLDAVDLILELCQNDPELIPQHGRFVKLFYHAYNREEILYMIENHFWYKLNSSLALPDYYNEYHDFNYWAAYHPKIKQIVLEKLQEYQAETGEPNLRVRSVNFKSGDAYDINFWTEHKGFAHGLVGFYFGIWEEN